MDQIVNLDEVTGIIKRAKGLAKKYQRLTGRPLGITGEVAEFEACRLLGLDLARVREAGYDAVRRTGSKLRKVQVKGRVIADEGKKSQRVGSIRLEHRWDSVVLVLLDEDFEPREIYEARRAKIADALTKPGSKARNKRGQLGVSQFKRISKLVWPRT